MGKPCQNKKRPLMLRASHMEHTIEAVDLKRRSDIHLARKVWHVLAVSFMAVFYAYAPESWSITTLIAAWLIAVPIDFLRQKNPALNDFVVHLARPIMRQSEVTKLAGTTYLITGVLLIVLIFPRDIVLLTILFLAFADPIASYFGIRYGKDKIFGEKSLQGSMAAFIVCALITFIFMFTHGMLMDRLLIVSLLGGLIGAAAEAVPLWKLDDNLTLPILSAIFLWILFNLFGALPVYA